MKVERTDGADERRIATAMAVNSKVLNRIAPIWNGKLFRSKWTNVFGGWCVDYWNKYGKPPRKMVQSLYQKWAKKADHDTASLMDKFISGLSNDYARLNQDINPEYIIDLAGEYFEKVRILRNCKEAEAHVVSGDVKKAKEILEKSNPIEIGKGSVINFLKDKSFMKEVFASKAEPLITYPHALGNFFGTSLERDGFIAILGPEKAGKTFWLTDFVWRAIHQQRKTAFFQVGDLSRNQIGMRLAIRAARHPFEAGTINVPTGLDKSGDALDTMPKPYKFKQGITREIADKARRALAKKLGRDDLLQISVHPNDSISAAGIESQLRTWARDGWTPDVVVVDYADILAPISGTGESRDQINATWKRLRRISQEFHCLMITATQANAASYKQTTLDRSNFSEDKRKYAHVTGMFALSQEEGEKEQGITRVNWLVLREASFDIRKCCTVAGCLEIGNPAMFSIF